MAHTFAAKVNKEMVELGKVEKPAEIAELRQLLEDVSGCVLWSFLSIARIQRLLLTRRHSIFFSTDTTLDPRSPIVFCETSTT